MSTMLCRWPMVLSIYSTCHRFFTSLFCFGRTYTCTLANKGIAKTYNAHACPPVSLCISCHHLLSSALPLLEHHLQKDIISIEAAISTRNCNSDTTAERLHYSGFRYHNTPNADHLAPTSKLRAKQHFMLHYTCNSRLKIM